MISLRFDDAGWPDHWRPRGEGTFNKEPFSDWWQRLGDEFPSLHPVAAEQWIHRHWRYSPFFGLPLQDRRTELEIWPTDRVLTEVHFGDQLNGDWDFNQLSPHHTGRSMMATGTWDYPLLVLSTPDGFVDWGGEYPEGRFRLIEGHLRFRFLHALVHLDRPVAPSHEVLVLR